MSEVKEVVYYEVAYELSMGWPAGVDASDLGALKRGLMHKNNARRLSALERVGVPLGLDLTEV